MTRDPVRLVQVTSPGGVDDLVLSADQPVSKLLGPLVQLLGLDSGGDWALWHSESQRDAPTATAIACRLAPGVTLAEVGVLDGDGLQLKVA